MPRQDIISESSRGWWVAIGLFLVQVFLTVIFSWQLPAQIPLYYSLPYGRGQLVERWWFLMLLGISLLSFLSMGLISKISGHFLAIYRDLLMWLTTLILFLITVAMVHIIVIIL